MGNITSLILNYNDAETTMKLINHIVGYEVLDHILVVDNCSTDNSFNVLSHIQNNKVIVIRSDRNGGYGYGNNYGIKYIYEKLKSEFILITNPDVEYTEQTVSQMIEVLKQNNNSSVVSTVAIRPDGSRQPDTGWKVPSLLSYTLSASIVLAKLFKLDQYPEEYFEGTGTREVDCVPGSLLLVRTSDMMKYGMYDDNIFLYCEETTLGYKLKKNNRKTLMLLDNYFVHHHSVSINKSIEGVLKQRKIMIDSKFKFIRSYLKPNSFQIFLVKIFFGLALIENRLIFKIKGV